jgi:hypothetical protein
MRKKLKLSSDSGDSGSKKCKRGYVGTSDGVWQSLETGSQYCVGAFGRNLALVTMKIFSHFIYFIKKFYKFCTFNAICRR